MKSPEPIRLDRIDRAILILRGHRVLLDNDLAALYGVEVKALNRAVSRNSTRFPSDFMFRLTQEETRRLRSRIVILNAEVPETTAVLDLRSRSVTSSSWGGRRHLPHVFTEQGVAMLSSVLRSPRAVQVNIEIMRAFVRLRQLLLSNVELAAKLAALEKKYDAEFRVVFDANSRADDSAEGAEKSDRVRKRSRIGSQISSGGQTPPAVPSSPRSAVHGLLIVFPYLAVPGLAAVVIVALVLVQGQRLQATAVERLAEMGCPKCGEAIAAETATSARAEWQEPTRRAHEHGRSQKSLVRIDPLWRFRCAACGAALTFDPSGRNPPIDQGESP